MHISVQLFVVRQHTLKAVMPGNDSTAHPTEFLPPFRALPEFDQQLRQGLDIIMIDQERQTVILLKFDASV